MLVLVLLQLLRQLFRLQPRLPQLCGRHGCC